MLEICLIGAMCIFALMTITFVILMNIDKHVTYHIHINDSQVLNELVNYIGEYLNKRK
jgi:hypothetical protein